MHYLAGGCRQQKIAKCTIWQGGAGSRQPHAHASWEAPGGRNLNPNPTPSPHWTAPGHRGPRQRQGLLCRAQGRYSAADGACEPATSNRGEACRVRVAWAPLSLAWGVSRGLHHILHRDRLRGWQQCQHTASPLIVAQGTSLSYRPCQRGRSGGGGGGDPGQGLPGIRYPS
jgi:hypothetical protein